MTKFDPSQVHLQWFSDPAEPPAPEFPQMPHFDSTYLEDAEVIIEDPAQAAGAPKPEEVDALKKQLEEQKRQIEELKRQGDTAQAVQAGIAGLAQSLRAPGAMPTAQAPVPAQLPGETDEAFQKRIDEGLLERGATKTVEEIVGRKLMPEVQRLFQGNLVNSRRFTSLDPARGPLYAKYRAEVEQLVAGLPPASKLYDPEVYEKATDEIARRHAEDIINERVQAAVQAELAKVKPPEPARPAPGAPAVHAEIGARPAPSTTKKELRLTPAEAAYAASHMIPAAVYAEYLQRKGQKK